MSRRSTIELFGGRMVRIPAWSHEKVLAADPLSPKLARDFVRMHLHATTYTIWRRTSASW
jgi:hypothetical protein